MKFSLPFCLLLFSVWGYAQERGGDIGLHIGLNKSVYVGSMGNGFFDLDQSFNSAFTIGLKYDVLEHYSSSLLFSQGDLSYKAKSNESDILDYNHRFQYLRFRGAFCLNNDFILPERNRFKVFVSHSIGAARNQDRRFSRRSHLSLGLGAGVKSHVLKEIEIAYHFGYNWTFLESMTDELVDKAIGDRLLLHEISLIYTLPISEDFDADGVFDHHDDCPRDEGQAGDFGCPDSDNDGVLDKYDRCPNDSGPLDALGCPDRDSDGIVDIDDKCPDKFGYLDNAGCPTDDRDNDGIKDENDRCPLQAGRRSLKGCPDTDHDGVADIDDECPELQGTKKTSGCPDKDGDGVRDSEDECPSLRGKAKLNGCPGKDTDGDGIMDSEDKCPELKGTRSGKGCPDQDRDGVIDRLDKCPTVSGSKSDQGCPDTDGDGIVDNEDRCPNVFGVKSKNGCPHDGFQFDYDLTEIAKKIQFQNASLSFTSGSFSALHELKRRMQEDSSMKLMIMGYSSDYSSDELNTIKSLERTGEIRDFLSRNGISKRRLVTIGMSSSETLRSEIPNYFEFKVSFN